ncbi:MAG: acyl-CoA thioesterase [Candidatus Limnocylindria bacterium]|jgi:acyl-CoA thioesterase
MGDFSLDTRVEGEGGRYRATLSEDWRIWGPNGGYVAAIALRAAGAEARIPRPVAFAAHFISIARFEPVEIEVTAVQRGRRSESLRVSMRQGDRAVLEAIVRTAAGGEGLAHDAAAAPQVPPPDALPDMETVYAGEPGPPFPFWNNIECRPPEGLAHKNRSYGGAPEMSMWYRFRPAAAFEEPFLDAGRVLVLLDILPWNAAWAHHGPTAWNAPNLDVVAWFHRSASKAEWLLGAGEAPLAEDGLIGSTSRVYDASGRLLASGGAQLLCVKA